MRITAGRQISTRPPRELPPPFQPRVFWVAREDATAATRYANHLHAHYELIICERGVYRCRVAGNEVSLRPGEALLVCPGDAHEDPLNSPVRYLGCGFRLHPVAASARSPTLLAPGTSRRLPPGGMAQAALAIRLDAAIRTPLDRHGWAALDAACAGWLWETLPLLPDPLLAPAFRRGDPQSDTTARLHAAFSAALSANATLTGLAQHAGLSPRAFATACRRHLGLPPLAAFRHARCSAAAALLAQGASVAEAATRLGFANPFHFSRVFRRALGSPPSEWSR